MVVNPPLGRGRERGSNGIQPGPVYGMLTDQQSRLYEIIVRAHGRDGVVPSYEGLANELGLRSKSTVSVLVAALEEKGYLRRLPGRARAIEPVSRLERARAAAASVPARRAAEARGTLSIPVCGRIAAGVPTEAVADSGAHVEIPASMVGTGEHFALEVSGLSMVGAGIMDGDLAILRRQDRAADGEIVVALVDGEETTLKRIRSVGRGMFALEAENPDFPTRTFPSGRVAVQGKLVGVIRRYH